MCEIYRICNGCGMNTVCPRPIWLGVSPSRAKMYLALISTGSGTAICAFFSIPIPPFFRLAAITKSLRCTPMPGFLTYLDSNTRGSVFSRAIPLPQTIRLRRHSSSTTPVTFSTIRPRPPSTNSSMTTTIKTVYPIGCAGGNQSAIILFFPAGMKITTSSPTSIRTTTPPYPIACPITKNLF